MYPNNSGNLKSKMKIKKKKKSIENILFITLTNIGDVILTTPALGVLLRQFPQAKITVIVSPQAANLFEDNPCLHKVIIYDKFLPLFQKMRLFLKLRREKFDMVIDLKNTLFGFLLPVGCKTPLFRKHDGRVYKKDVFLDMLRNLFEKGLRLNLEAQNGPFYIWTSEKDKQEANFLLEECFGAAGKKLIAVNPFAKSSTKTWSFENYVELIKLIKSREDLEVVLVGSGQDEENCRQLAAAVGEPFCNLCGKTSLRVLAEVLKRCTCLITNDSAPMHLSAAVGTKVVAVFGPSDPEKYAPRGQMHEVLTADLNCRPCEKAQCVFGKKTPHCLENISVEEVFNRFTKVIL